MFIGKIVKMFEHGNVSIAGLRGTGKDLLMANVVARRKKPYVSNINYGGTWIPFEYKDINVSENTYKNFIEGNVTKYVYPFPEGTDVYLSDCGIYFPAQYCKELNKQYPSLPTFFALSRHLGLCNVHYNAQALSRVWDKIREQSDQYIVCLGAKIVLGWVFQRIAIFDRYESAVKVMPELRLPKPFFENKEHKLRRETTEELYRAENGSIKYATLIYRNKACYDTRAFKEILSKGDEK